MIDNNTAKHSDDVRRLSDLERLIAQVNAIDFSSQTSEQATREMAVNPIIAALGWDTFNPNEVAREYSVLGGKVDYCLRAPPRRDLVLIEVKRVDTDLSEHQEQLLRYAFDVGTPLAVLTDGLLWWLYLPRANTSWEQRRFFRIDFREQSTTGAAAAIYRFLNRHGVVGGKCLEEAQQEFESQERDRRVRAALQEAWQRMLKDPPEPLRGLLSETVREISGDVPSHGEITEFLEGISGIGSARTILSTKPPRRGNRHTLKHESGRPPSTTDGTVEGDLRSERKQPFRFSMVGISVGATLTSRWDDKVRCTVLSDNKIKFKNQEMSLSAAALQVVRDRGKNWKAVSGPESWIYNGETLATLRRRQSMED